MKQLPIDLSTISVLVDGLDHPEGVAWDPEQGVLYAGGEAGQIYRVDVDARTFTEVANTGGFVLGLAIDGSGLVYACDLKRAAVIRIDPDEGSVAVYTSGTGDEPMRTPNYPAFDAAGRLYVSDSGEWEQNDGVVFAIEPDGTTFVWSRAPGHFTNGIALSPDRKWLYVVESLLPGLSRVEILDDGSAGRYEIVARLDGTVPDGVAFTADGDPIVSCYAPSRLLLIDESNGSATTIADDPGVVTLAAPTNVSFIGPNLDRIAIASLGRWHLGSAELGVSGARLEYPTVQKADTT